MDLLNEISQAVVIGVGLAYAAHSLRQYRAQRRQSLRYQLKIARAEAAFKRDTEQWLQLARAACAYYDRTTDEWGARHYAVLWQDDATPAHPIAPTLTTMGARIPQALPPTPTATPTPIRRAPVTRPLPVLVERVESLVTA